MYQIYFILFVYCFTVFKNGVIGYIYIYTYKFYFRVDKIAHKINFIRGVMFHSTTGWKHCLTYISIPCESF